MKTVSFVLLTACLARGQVLKPEDAAGALTRAFDEHSIVMLGENHGSKQEYEFLTKLVALPAFADTVDDIVMEFGNALYQTTIDRYVAGENVSPDDVKKAWQNTTALGPASPVYGWLYEAVRQVNQKRAGQHRLRVLLGDPYVDWERVHNREDLGPFIANREVHYINVVKDNVIAKKRKALLIMGSGHFQRSAGEPGHIESEIRKSGVEPYVVLPGTNITGSYDDADKRFDSWPSPSIVRLKGTWVGELAASAVLSGGTAPLRPNPIKMANVADAMLYLGPRDRLTQLHLSRADLEGTPYGREIARRLQLIYDRPVNFLPQAVESPQFPRNPTPPLPLPAPPKSARDPLPPRPAP